MLGMYRMPWLPVLMIGVHLVTASTFYPSSWNCSTEPKVSCVAYDILDDSKLPESDYFCLDNFPLKYKQVHSEHGTLVSWTFKFNDTTIDGFCVENSKLWRVLLLQELERNSFPFALNLTTWIEDSITEDDDVYIYPLMTESKNWNHVTKDTNFFVCQISSRVLKIGFTSAKAGPNTHVVECLADNCDSQEPAVDIVRIQSTEVTFSNLTSGNYCFMVTPQDPSPLDPTRCLCYYGSINLRQCYACGRSSTTYTMKDLEEVTENVLHSEAVSAPSKTVSAHSETVSAPSKTVSAHSETVSAHSETVSAPSKTVSAHSETVSAHSETVSAPSKTVSAHSETVSAHSETVSAPSKTVSAHSETVSAHSETVSAPSNTVSAHSETVSAHSVLLKTRTDSNEFPLVALLGTLSVCLVVIGLILVVNVRQHIRKFLLKSKLCRRKILILAVYDSNNHRQSVECFSHCLKTYCRCNVDNISIDVLGKETRSFQNVGQILSTFDVVIVFLSQRLLSLFEEIECSYKESRTLMTPRTDLVEALLELLQPSSQTVCKIVTLHFSSSSKTHSIINHLSAPDFHLFAEFESLLLKIHSADHTMSEVSKQCSEMMMQLHDTDKFNELKDLVSSVKQAEMSTERGKTSKQRLQSLNVDSGKGSSLSRISIGVNTQLYENIYRFDENIDELSNCSVWSDSGRKHHDQKSLPNYNVCLNSVHAKCECDVSSLTTIGEFSV
ncbi:uncharacterized protein LOC110452659 isoform X2 [Mizuhopecten yessoensis]|uniref:uncharacterized protein LOC110452659 isoform X2 n=1 Tax=Mizuhopecten yessoensis TaxID=6573 RepID=UPI000B4592CB|nr:uncharacterized protein LOC110452659 isoform X2 [Mizuhopecten yessoensis]